MISRTGRVAFFLPSLEGGGAERVMVALANGLAARALPVDLVLARADGPYASEVSERVRVVDLGVRRVARSVPHLARYFRRERPRAMLSAMTHANVAALFAKKLAGVATRMVVSEHASWSPHPRCGPRIREPAIRALARRVYGAADRVVAVSNGVARELVDRARLSAAHVEVVYNPIDIDRILALSRTPIEHPWYQDTSRPVVLGAGRLAAEKDFATLLRAFETVRRVRGARLVILGEGAERARLQVLAAQLGLEGTVELPGFVENPFPWMRRAAVLAMSSLWEGFGNVLVEAMACGTAAVSTDCPSGPAEVLEGGRWGRLVPLGDAAALAAAIVDGIDGRLERPEPDYLKARFGVEWAVGRYAEVIGCRYA
ncbi:MAG TPA: glycosyltransferase [Burkholderiales bacterium]